MYACNVFYTYPFTSIKSMKPLKIYSLSATTCLNLGLVTTLIALEDS